MKSKLLEKLFSLQGKNALITGGYRGIGRIIAETYAELGANVAIVARNREKCELAASELAQKYGGKAIGLPLNVRDAKMADSIVGQIADTFGGIDILINNAGIAGAEKEIVRMSDEEIDEIMNINFRGCFIMARAVARIMIKQQSGKIINMASILGKIAARNMAGYCASKGAVIQLTRVLALELAHNNIQVNTLCPGYFSSDINREFFASEKGREFIKRMIPVNRPGELSELKSTAIYLATCPAFLTGTEIYIDGGHTIF